MCNICCQAVSFYKNHINYTEIHIFIFMKTPPDPTFGKVKLPGTTLHYVKAGSGPPLVIVPATVSLISQWLPLTQFMGQRFTAYFFELPGHGQSTPYPYKF